MSCLSIAGEIAKKMILKLDCHSCQNNVGGCVVFVELTSTTDNYETNKIFRNILANTLKIRNYLVKYFAPFRA